MALLIEYDGADFQGWQSQPSGMAVQDVVETALASVYGTRLPIVGSGRTDAGVHATGQVAHLSFNADAPKIPLHKVCIAINTRLPRSIRIKDVEYVADDFHARYSARRRAYRYYITNDNTAFNYRHKWAPKYAFRNDLFVDALAAFVGKHDFTTFSKRNEETQSYVCNVERCDVKEYGSDIIVAIEADRFVYGMCRAIVGAAYDVARGHRSVDDIQQSLAQHDRNLSSPMAPAHGLYLHKIGYDVDLFTNATPHNDQ